MTAATNVHRRPRFDGLVGAARRDVTPPAGIHSGLWGAARWERIAGAHRPLTLTAVSFADAAGAEPLLLVTIDLAAWRRPVDERRLRSAVQRALGLGEAAVIVHLMHTHSSPSICPEDRERAGGELIVPYLDALEEAAVGAAREARDGAVPARIEWGVGSCRLAAVRDLPAGDRDLIGYNPAVPADETVLVGRATDAAGAVVTTLVNYACHPTTLGWESELASPDYAGAMRELVEHETGAPCAFLQGAEGDLAPREQYTGDPLVADRHGRGLGHAVLAVLAAMDPAEPVAGSAGDRPLAVHAPVELLLKDPEDIDALAARFWPDLDPLTRDSRIRRARWRRQQIGDGATADYPVWLWRLGGAVVVAFPGEAYSELQIELRARRPTVPLVVLSLANGPIWTYLPPADRFGRNVYQVWHTLFAAGCHERVLEHVDAQLASLLDDVA